MSDLLPCPFCGGEAETLTAESMHVGYLFGIMCNDCCSRGDVYGTEAEAIAAWNNRTERTCRVEHRPVNQELRCRSWLECSECGAEIENYEWNYCPNCGAKVVGE